MKEIHMTKIKKLQESLPVIVRDKIEELILKSAFAEFKSVFSYVNMIKIN